MNIKPVIQSCETLPCDLLVLNQFSAGETPFKKLGGGTGDVDAALDGLITKFAKEERFVGKEGQALLFHTHGKIPANRVLVIGLGKPADFSTETVRKAAGFVIKIAKRVGAKKVGTILHGAGASGLQPADAARVLTEGLLLANYTFLHYKSKENKHEQKYKIQEILIAQKDRKNIRAIEKGVQDGTREAEATILTRDLVNEPAGKVTPAHLVEVARQIAKDNRGVRVKAYGREALKKMGAGGLLGIAQGSDTEPFLIHLAYKPTPRQARGRKLKKIALVGKGITFDSGGISIKPGEAMYTMKLDMAGGAAILGLFSILSGLDLPLEVHGFIGACENMPSGKAIKPGDIVKTISGKTIEVLHTDAEGRVVLADVLAYAQKFKPDIMIDLATLTGACMVALGEDVAGLMSNNDALAEKIYAAAEVAGEKVWRLPLVKEYKGSIKSDVADVKNVSSRRWGGAITAGLFLEEFVDPKLSWAHLDIAGPAFAEAETVSYIPKGGTGFGVRTLVHFLKNL